MNNLVVKPMNNLVVKPMSLEQLLLECANFINEYGPESDEVDRFIDAHSDQSEFVELATLSRRLKRVLEVKESRLAESK